MTILGGTNTGIAFYAGSQSGQFLAGAGANLFEGNSQYDAGNWSIMTGNGNDTVNSGAGNNTISAGLGHNTIDLGSGMNYVHSDGQDTITATSGRQSVTLSGSSSTVQLSDNSLVVDANSSQQITVGGASTVTGVLWIISTSPVQQALLKVARTARFPRLMVTYRPKTPILH